jgi:hypothetical protein
VSPEFPDSIACTIQNRSFTMFRMTNPEICKRPGYLIILSEPGFSGFKDLHDYNPVNPVIR